MSPRPRQSSITSSNNNSTKSRRTTSKKSPRSSPEISSMTTGSHIHSMTNSHFLMNNSLDTSHAGSQLWNANGSHAISDSDVHFDTARMNVDDFSLGDGYMLPVMSVNNCYPTSTTTYPMLSQGAMSQTLTGPYQGPMFDSDLMPSSALSMEYTEYPHYPQATIRHGLPSPPAECYNEFQDDFSMGSMNDMTFSALPAPSMDDTVQLDKASIMSAARQAQPRPIRSASEKSIRSPSTVAVQDLHFPRDERADKVKARNDPRYEMKPDDAGYYHCPMAGEEPCNHKPTKQKCIYAKYLDSHLKPYFCKHGGPGNDCENLRFSSNACLFRHEREAHGMHNHGINPYLCIFTGCERARNDNGFPRRWNQRDHMKRVHDWIEADTEDVHGDKYGPPDTTRRRKSGNAGVQMKRSTSSQARAQIATTVRGSRSIDMTRYQAQVDKQMPNCNVVNYPMLVNDVQYAQCQSQPRTTSPFADSYTRMTF